MIKSVRYVVPHFVGQDSVVDLPNRIKQALASAPGVVRVMGKNRWGVFTFSIDSCGDTDFDYESAIEAQRVFNSVLEKLATIHPNCICYSYRTLDRDTVGLNKIRYAEIDAMPPMVKGVDYHDRFGDES